MRIHKLKLTGFKGIASGMGRETIELDLDALAGSAQLVALVGPNGSGKTTIMDNLHPYRLMPSHCGDKLTPSGFSFYEHLYLPLNEKVLEWSVSDRRYLSTLVWRVNGKNKTECFIHDITTGQAVPVCLPDGTVSDGKTDTYDRIVDHIVGSSEMFFTSNFGAQNRRQLSQLAASDVKRLFTELLGHKDIIELAKKAQQTAKGFRDRLEFMRPQLAEAANARGALETLEAEFPQATVAVQTAETAVITARACLDSAQVVLATAQAAVNGAAETETRRTRLVDRITALDVQRQADLKIANEQLARIDSRLANHDVEQVQEGRLVEQRRQKRATERLGAESRIAKSAAIEQAAQDLPRLAEAVTAAEALLEAARAKVQALTELRSRWQAADSGSKSIASLVGSAETTLNQCRSRASLTDEVPCLGTDLQDRCKLLSEAVTAKGQIPILDAALVEKRTEQAKAVELVKSLADEIEKSGLPQALVLQHETALKAARQALSDAQLLASERPLLDAARTLLASLAEQDKEEAEAWEAKQLQATATRSTLVVERTEVAERVAEVESRYQAERGAAATELASLPGPVAQQLQAAEQGKVNAEKSLRTAELAADQAKGRVAQFESHMSVAKLQMQDGLATEAEAKAIEGEIAFWVMLSKALGNDGIIALSIDDAAPTLSAMANDLLMSCYGPRFTASIQTQVEMATGAMKEGFDVLVNDAERNESKSVSVMSGGERVWINESLARALSLYLSQGTKGQVATLFSDESDGPLDPERKRQFIAMKREVLRIGGFEQEFFVSQSPELWELADRVIDVAAMKVAA